MKRFWFATWILCLLWELLVPAAMAAVSASRQGDQVFISGDHFRLTIDGKQGGQISDVRLFDGSRWNRLLGADGQTCPAVKICEPSAEFRLDKAANTRIENLEVSPEVVRLETTAVPCAADGRASPWTVKLQYEVYAEGAVFVTMHFSLPQGETVLSGAEISLAADRAVVQAAKYRQQIDSPNVNSPTGLPTARLAFGVNPARSFTNEIQAIVEYKASMAGKPQFAADQGRFTWTAGRRADNHPRPVRVSQPVLARAGCGRDRQTQDQRHRPAGLSLDQLGRQEGHRRRGVVSNR